MPFFFDPNWDALIEALPGTVAPGEAPRFPPVLAGPYLLVALQRYLRLSQAGGGRGLIAPPL